jgi:hypothetical protein
MSVFVSLPCLSFICNDNKDILIGKKQQLRFFIDKILESRDFKDRWAMGIKTLRM